MRAIASLTPAEAVVRSRLHAGVSTVPARTGTDWSSRKARTGKRAWRRGLIVRSPAINPLVRGTGPEGSWRVKNFPPTHTPGMVNAVTGLRRFSAWPKDGPEITAHAA